MKRHSECTRIIGNREWNKAEKKWGQVLVSIKCLVLDVMQYATILNQCTGATVESRIYIHQTIHLWSVWQGYMNFVWNWCSPESCRWIRITDWIVSHTITFKDYFIVGAWIPWITFHLMSLPSKVQQCSECMSLLYLVYYLLQPT